MLYVDSSSKVQKVKVNEVSYGFIVSHRGYGLTKYGNSIKSTLTLTEVDNKTVSLEILSFQLHRTNCSDYLSVDFLHTSLKWCNGNYSEFLNVTAEEISFNFVTGAKGRQNGFVLYFSGKLRTVMGLHYNNIYDSMLYWSI